MYQTDAYVSRPVLFYLYSQGRSHEFTLVQKGIKNYRIKSLVFDNINEKMPPMSHHPQENDLNLTTSGQRR